MFDLRKPRENKKQMSLKNWKKQIEKEKNRIKKLKEKLRDGRIKRNMVRKSRKM